MVASSSLPRKPCLPDLRPPITQLTTSITGSHLEAATLRSSLPHTQVQSPSHSQIIRISQPRNLVSDSLASSYLYQPNYLVKSYNGVLFMVPVRSSILRFRLERSNRLLNPFRFPRRRLQQSDAFLILPIRSLSAVFPRLFVRQFPVFCLRK